MTSDGSPTSRQIICIGAANIDVRCALEIPSVDGTSNLAEITQSTGGAALNTARILAANGQNTKLIGLVGDDEGAAMIDDAVTIAGVSNGLKSLDGQRTGRYFSMLEPDGSLKIACNDMKIHQNFSPSMLDEQLESQAPDQIGAIFCDTNIPRQTIRRAFEFAPDRMKCATTVSPAKAHKLGDCLDKIDLLFTNVVEATALLGLDRGQKSKGPTANELAELLVKTPIKSGVISDGANPLYYWHNGKTYSLEIPPLADIVDVVGAGDALAAGTIAGLVGKSTLVEALHNGIKAAQKVLLVSGAYSPRFV